MFEWLTISSHHMAWCAVQPSATLLIVVQCHCYYSYAMVCFTLLTTSERAHACVSTLSWPDTVKQQRRPKKSFEKSTWPALSTGMSATLASSG